MCSERKTHAHKGDQDRDRNIKRKWMRHSHTQRERERVRNVQCEWISRLKIMVLGGDKKTAATIKDFLELFSCTGKQNAYTMILNRSLNYRTGHKSQPFSTFLSSFLVDFSLFYVMCFVSVLYFSGAYINTNTIHERNLDFFLLKIV